MKKLESLRLKRDAHFLEESEMKQIRGGSVCAYNTDYNSPTIYCLMPGGAAEAAFMAGPYGWWCCGCADAYLACI